MQSDRGSEKMLQERIDRRTLTKEELRGLLQLVQREGVELRDIWIYGQPDPNVVYGNIQVRPEEAGSVLQELISQDIRLRLKAFPRGIPFPDIVEIDFESIGHNGP